jgi:hypothetical protein
MLKLYRTEDVRKFKLIVYSSYSTIQLLDSKYGRGSFAALHLQKGSGSGSGPSQPSVAVVVPIDARALWQHSDKVSAAEIVFDALTILP